MITNLSLLHVPERQLANRQVRLAISGSSIVKTFENVKLNGNLEQTVPLPWESGLEHCNMVLADGRYYDILTWDNTTYEGRQMLLTIKLEPFATYIQPESNVFGFLERTPTLVHMGAKIAVSKDVLRPSHSVTLPSLPAFGTGRINWVEVVSTADIEPDPIDNSRFTIYGFPIIYRPEEMTLSNESWLDAAPDFPTTGAKRWPSLLNAMTDIDQIIGIPASSIQTVSVSGRSPWGSFINGTSGSMMMRNLNDTGSEQIKAGTSIDNLVVSKITGKNIEPVQTTSPGAIDLTDFERLCGTVTLVDQMGNTVSEVPTEVFDSSNRLIIRSKTVSDITGIYTVLWFDGLDANYTLVEGKLPWAGSAWDEYVRQNLTYDREMLAIQNQTAGEQFGIDVLESTADAALTAAVGSSMLVGTAVSGALAGGQLVAGTLAAGARMASNIKASESSQLAREGQAKVMPSSTYQAGYGLEYLRRGLNADTRPRFLVQTPGNITEADFNNFVSYYGYPCDKVSTCPLETGFLKGNIYDFGTYQDAIPSTALSLIRNEIAKGLRFVVP